MKRLLVLCSWPLLVLGNLHPLGAQEIDGSDLNRQAIEREARVNKLSLEDQLKLRAAQQKAMQDPEMQAALKKRNEALKEFRAAYRASLIKADPSVAPILEQVAIKD